MLKDPMLYMAAIFESFFFALIESAVGYFNLNMSFKQTAFLVIASIIGIFGSLFLYAMLSNVEHRIESDIARDTRKRMRQRGWKPPRK